MKISSTPLLIKILHPHECVENAPISLAAYDTNDLLLKELTNKLIISSIYVVDLQNLACMESDVKIWSLSAWNPFILIINNKSLSFDILMAKSSIDETQNSKNNGAWIEPSWIKL